MNNKTCEERIQANMEARIEDAIGAREKDLEIEEGKTEDTEGTTECLNEGVLEISVEKHVKILLSTGGPADWFVLVYDKDDRLLRGEYHFSDWWDHAERVLKMEDARAVESVYLCGEPSIVLNNE